MSLIPGYGPAATSLPTNQISTGMTAQTNTTPSIFAPIPAVTLAAHSIPAWPQTNDEVEWKLCLQAWPKKQAAMADAMADALGSVNIEKIGLQAIRTFLSMGVVVESYHFPQSGGQIRE